MRLVTYLLCLAAFMALFLPLEAAASQQTGSAEAAGSSRQNPLQLAKTATVTDRQAEADQLFADGEAYLEDRQFQAAFTSFEQALAVYQEINDYVKEAQTFLRLADAYRHTEQYKFEQFSIYLHRAFNIISTVNSDILIDEEIRIITGIRQLIISDAEFYGNNTYDQYGIDHLQNFLPLFILMEDSVGEAQALDLLSHFYFRLNQDLQGAQAAQRAISLYQSLGDYGAERGVWRALGRRYLWTDQFQPALNAYQQALIISQSLDDPIRKIEDLMDISRIYQNLEDLDQAITANQEAAVLSQELGNLNRQVDILSSLAKVYQQNHQAEQAINTYQAIINLSSMHKQRVIAPDIKIEQANISICNIYLEFYSIETSFNCHQAAIKMIGERLGYEPISMLIDIGNQYFENGHMESASFFYQRATHEDQSGKYEQAGLSITEIHNEHNAKLTELIRLGEAYLAENHLTEAFGFYQGAVEVLEVTSPPICENSCMLRFSSWRSQLILRALSPFLERPEYHYDVRDIHQRVLNLIAKLDDEEAVLLAQAVIAESWGDAYTATGNETEAFAAYERSANFYRTVDLQYPKDDAARNITATYGILNILRKLGDLHLAANRVNQAFALHQEWIEKTAISPRGGDIIADDARNIRVLAARYLRLGASQYAEQLFQQAVDLEQNWLTTGERDMGQMEDLDRIQFLNQWGREYQDYSQYQHALAYYQQALSLNKYLQNQAESQENSLDFLGETYGLLGSLFAVKQEIEVATK